MPKRSLASLSASPSRQKKKAKLSSSGQSRLDSFFGAPGPRPTPDPAEPHHAPRGEQSSPASAPSGSDSRDKGKGNAKQLVRPPSDEEVAWALAAADGLDIETIRKLESGGSGVHLSSSAVPAPDASTLPEVIDVDALDSDDGTPSPPGISSRNEHRQRTPRAASASTSKSASTGVARVPTSPTPPPAAAARSPKAPRTFDNNALRTRTTTTTIGNASTSAAPTYEPLNVDPPAYDPDSAAAAAAWPSDAPVPYAFLAHALSTLSGTRSRIAKLNTLTNALRTICRQHPDSLLPALYLLSNSLSPPYSPVELGLGPSIISKAIQHVSGLSSAALKRLYNATGDPGEPARPARGFP